MHKHFRELSDALFVGVLLVASVAVVGAVLTVVWSTHEVWPSYAQEEGGGGGGGEAPPPAAPGDGGGGGGEAPPADPGSGGGGGGAAPPAAPGDGGGGGGDGGKGGDGGDGGGKDGGGGDGGKDGDGGDGGGADPPPPDPGDAGGGDGAAGTGRGGGVEVETPTPTVPPIVVTVTPTPRPASAAPASAVVQRAAQATVALVTATSVSVAPVAATIAVGSAVITAATAASAAPGGLFGLFQAFLPFLWVRRRRLPIGRVVEEGANLPIAGAVITILDSDGKPRQTVRSKSDGGFAALLPRGQYLLAVNHPGYTLSAHPRGVALFPDERLYTGTPVTVTGEETILPLVLGLTPSGKRRPRGLGSRLRPLVERLRVLQARFAVPIVLLGAAVNTFALWQRPSPVLIAFEVLYGVLLCMELLLSRVVRRAVGRVRDGLRRGPVALAMVRLVDAKTQRLVATRVTSPQGQFLLMPPPGQYLLQVIHTSYVPYSKKNFEIGKGITGAARVSVDLQPRGSGGPGPARPPPSL